MLAKFFAFSVIYLGLVSNSFAQCDMALEKANNSRYYILKALESTNLIDCERYSREAYEKAHSIIHEPWQCLVEGVYPSLKSVHPSLKIITKYSENAYKSDNLRTCKDRVSRARNASNDMYLFIRNLQYNKIIE